MTCGPAMISYSCWFVQVCVFFESLAECSLTFTYVCVAAVDVTRDVIYGSTLVFFGCFCLWGVLSSSGGCSPACGTCVCCVTYKSGQAVLIVLPRMVVPT